MKLDSENGSPDLAELLRVARAGYKREIEVKTAVLRAWALLTGESEWTDEMVDRVEREMAR